jgi:[calcium/calmodulin-dependent protein kinase] kinase
MGVGFLLRRSARTIFSIYSLLYYADFITNVAIMTFVYDSWVENAANTGWLMLIMIGFMFPFMGTVLYSIHPLDVFRLRVAVCAIQGCSSGTLPVHASTVKLTQVSLYAETAPQFVVHAFWLSTRKASVRRGLSDTQEQMIDIAMGFGSALMVMGVLHLQSLIEEKRKIKKERAAERKLNKEAKNEKKKRKSSIAILENSATKEEPRKHWEDELGDIIVGGDDTEYNMTNLLTGEDDDVYQMRSTLGSGAFGSVRRAVKTLPDGTKHSYAVKIFDHRALNKKNVQLDATSHKRVIHTGRDDAEREIAIMKKLEHPNLINLEEVIWDDGGETADGGRSSPMSHGTLYVIIELAELGQVMVWDQEVRAYKCPQTHAPLTNEKAAMHLRDVCLALHYLHTHNIAHRDIKPENILLCSNGTCKVADFGVSKLFDTTESSKNFLLEDTAGTYHFQAPESLSEGKYDVFKADIWGMGVTLFCFLFGKMPFSVAGCKSEEQEQSEVFQAIETRETEALIDTAIEEAGVHISEEARTMLLGIMHKDPTQRSGIYDVFGHGWMSVHSHYIEILLEKYKMVDISETEIASAISYSPSPFASKRTLQLALNAKVLAAVHHHPLTTTHRPLTTRTSPTYTQPNPRPLRSHKPKTAVS